MVPLSEEEILQVQSQFPDLFYNREIHTWCGQLTFTANYNGYSITDNFEVRIKLSDNYPLSIPLVSEKGNRVVEIRKRYGLQKVEDLHYNSINDAACLCAPLEEKVKFPPGAKFIDFLVNLVVPYFFALSYFEKNGIWLWGEYNHGALGLLEHYLEKRSSFTYKDIIEMVKKMNIDRNWRHYYFSSKKINLFSTCLCNNTNEEFRRCHSVAYQGLQQLYLDSLLMNIPLLYIFR